MTDLSIIVIALNESENILKCLNALLSQDTDLNFEIIVIDDGSTDDTSDKIRHFKERQFLDTKHAQIRVIRNSINMGRGFSRDSGVRASKAKYIGFVDADIVVPNDWVDAIIAELAEFSGVSMIAVPDGDVAVIARIFNCETKSVKGSAGINGGNVIFKCEVFEKHRFDQRARLGEDFKFAMELEKSGYKLKTISNRFVKHHESKSYRDAFIYIVKSGKKASFLLFEFKKIRIPDLLFLGFILACIVAFAFKLLYIILCYVLITTFFHVLSRFSMRTFWAFFMTFLADVPLIIGYFFGRLMGSFDLVFNLFIKNVKKILM